MTLRAIALRLLLCLTLILNGSGYAVASTQMHLSHLASTAQPAPVAVIKAPCHETAMEIAATAVDDGAMSDDCAGKANVSHSQDCCQSSHCNCECLQHVSTATAFIDMVASIPVRAEVAQTLNHDHVQPRLRSPLRPPIA
ncbi:CopL family metal-binding regulatory protein [Lysobacter panacisoli]|uniref:CopL family metal-binding regulatory protein n=1 Tax=Lysobacter panacisoli TaxID=1255263 RepID=A0ABP9LC08_9GAMM|nr:CopL family metal-binding regulatory protein [Lysobacter panacisoli]